MYYDFIAIPDADVPRAVEPAFQHVGTTYASEVNKTVGVWRAVLGHLLDIKSHEKTNTIRTLFAHQLLSERRFFAEFAGLQRGRVAFSVKVETVRAPTGPAARPRGGPPRRLYPTYPTLYPNFRDKA